MYKYRGRIVEFRELPLGVKIIVIAGKKKTKKMLKLIMIVSVIMTFTVSTSLEEDVKAVTVFNYNNEDIVRVGKIELPESSKFEQRLIEVKSDLVDDNKTLKISMKEWEEQLKYQEQKEMEKIEKFEVALSSNENKTLEHDPELINGKNIRITEDDIKLMAMVVHGEAGNQSYEGKKAVASVVINRLTSGYYGKNVNEVVYMGGGSQFNCVRDNRFGYYTEEDLQAVRDVLYINPYPDNMYYYANTDLVYERGMDVNFANFIEKNTYIKIEDHTFALGKEPKDV